MIKLLNRSIFIISSFLLSIAYYLFYVSIIIVGVAFLVNLFHIYPVALQVELITKILLSEMGALLILVIITFCSGIVSIKGDI